MTQAVLNELVAKARKAAAGDDPTAALRLVLQESFAEQEALAAAVEAQPEDEVLLFEDESCSIWTCRFDPAVVVPPHEHLMNAHIAVYRGCEVEVLFHRKGLEEADGLRHAKNRAVKAGEVLSLGPDVVHAVTAEGDAPCLAVHIYQGPLSSVERALFDWDTGREVAFTMDKFNAMLRSKAALKDLQLWPATKPPASGTYCSIAPSPMSCQRPCRVILPFFTSSATKGNVIRLLSETSTASFSSASACSASGSSLMFS